MSEDKKEFDSEAEIARVRDEAMNAPPPGEDPDSRQRLAKTLAAAGVDLPGDLSVDPVTEEDRLAYVDKVASPEAKAAASDRKKAAEAQAKQSTAADEEARKVDDDTQSERQARHQAPVGRSTKPTAKS